MAGQKKVEDGWQYEQYVADLLKQQGFRDIAFTKKTGDYGVDILATHGRNRYAVQCKYYSGSVGGAAVQEAAAGMVYYDCDRALVVTNSYLTDGAHKLAKANGVEVMEHIDPEQRSFLERLRPWQICLFAIELVAFGVQLFQLGDALTLRSVAILFGWCFLFPVPVLLLGKLILWLARGRRQENAPPIPELRPEEERSDPELPF